MDEQESKLKKLLTGTFKSIGEDQVTMKGAAIAFYSIFSAAPLLYIAITLVGILGGQQAMDILNRYLNQLMGQNLAKPLIMMAHAAHQQGGGNFASILSIISLIIGATTAIFQLRFSLNDIWGVEESEMNSILLTIIDRAISVVVIFGLMIVLFFSLILDSVTRSLNYSGRSLLPGFLNSTLNVIPNLFFIVLCILFFTVLFKLLPDIDVHWKDIFVGACVTTVLFFIGKYLIGIYINSSSVQSTYETTGAFILFLIWMYYNAQIVLIGAEFTKAYTDIYGAGAQAVKGTNFLKKVG